MRSVRSSFGEGELGEDHSLVDDLGWECCRFRSRAGAAVMSCDTLFLCPAPEHRAGAAGNRSTMRDGLGRACPIRRRPVRVNLRSEQLTHQSRWRIGQGFSKYASRVGNMEVVIAMT